MLERWFQEMNPVTTVLSGKREIINARLFTDGADIHPNCLYVGKINDFFPGSASNGILLIHRKDVISLKSDNLNQIFNMVLAAFDFYQELEQRIMNCAMNEKPEQHILEACEQLIGPTFILTPDFRILAISQKYNSVYVNEFWDTFVHKREPSLKMMEKMRKSTITSLTKTRQHMRVFREPNAKPYEYGIVNSYHDSHGQIIGFLILASDKPVTPFDHDMAEIILDMLNTALFKAELSHHLAISDTSEEILFSKLLEQTDLERSEQQLKILCRIPEKSTFSIVVIRSDDGYLYPSLSRKLHSVLAEQCIVMQTEQNIAVLYWYCGNTPLPDSIEKTIKILTDKIPVCCGFSNVFHELKDCFYYYEQAAYTAGQAASGLLFFYGYALEYLLECTDHKQRYYARHPAAAILETIDINEKNELKSTLSEYLMCERSIKRAAEKLFVHRNTVLYRINRIKEMNIINLEDDYERTYLLLSLLLK